MSKTTVVHFKKDAHDIYIGRPSQWGNPFSHLPAGTLARYITKTREDAIEQYAKWILKPEQAKLRALIPGLKGKKLGCWCHPKTCHGDVLAAMAEGKSWLNAEIKMWWESSFKNSIHLCAFTKPLDKLWDLNPWNIMDHSFKIGVDDEEAEGSAMEEQLWAIKEGLADCPNKEPK